MTPFKNNRTPEIHNMELNSRKEINAGDSLDSNTKQFFIESAEYLSNYNYCIITKEEKKISQNIIYDQLLKIQRYY
jgi:hypothetical protein